MKIILIAYFGTAFLFGCVMSRCKDEEDCWEDWSFPPPTGSCGDLQVCACSNITFDCSYSKLPFLPLLPPALNSYANLNFSYNNLSSISDDFFVNASREVTVIDLSHNGLVRIVDGVFHRFDRLTTLLLYSNYLPYSNLTSILSVPSLYTLKLGCSRLGSIPPNVFEGISNSSLSFLDLKFNDVGLASLNMSVFQPLKHLKKLSLWRNKIYELQTAHLPSLEQLHLETNRLYSFPRTCSPSGQPLFPNLRNLTIAENMIWCIDTPVCLPNVTELSLNFNNFWHFTTDTFSTNLFPGLRSLRIMQMENKNFGMRPQFINNSAVNFINFMFNDVDFSTVSDDAFDGCTNVQSFFLRGNVFQSVSEEKFHRLLQPMEESLHVLSLAETHMTHLSRNMFVRLKNLYELKLFGNSLTSLPDGAFDVIRDLTTLALDGNNIQTISEDTFRPEVRQRYTNNLAVQLSHHDRSGGQGDSGRWGRKEKKEIRVAVIMYEHGREQANGIAAFHIALR